MGPTPGSQLFRSSELTLCRVAPNAGPMTLEGTNSYLIGSPEGKGWVLVDPGPLAKLHLDDLLAAGDIELVLITHHHSDHTESSRWFHESIGAPVRALDPNQCYGAPPLSDGENIHSAGVLIRVIATPGHTSDSASFYLPHDGPKGSALTGDTILGRGTTVICYPDGQLGPYLQSLHKLSKLGPSTVLPGHGPQLPNLVAVCREYQQHRRQRLCEIEAALEFLGADANLSSLVEHVYNDAAPDVRSAAQMSVAAQLDYLGQCVNLP